MGWYRVAHAYIVSTEWTTKAELHTQYVTVKIQWSTYFSTAEHQVNNKPGKWSVLSQTCKELNAYRSFHEHAQAPYIRKLDHECSMYTVGFLRLVHFSRRFENYLELQGSFIGKEMKSYRVNIECWTESEGIWYWRQHCTTSYAPYHVNASCVSVRLCTSSTHCWSME